MITSCVFFLSFMGLFCFDLDFSSSLKLTVELPIICGCYSVVNFIGEQSKRQTELIFYK